MSQSRDETRAGYEARMLRVVQYIHANLNGDLSLDRLADVACMSRFHWHRVYHSMTGETLANAIRRIRLHRAAGYLLRSDKTIEDIAGHCGYPSVQSFNRTFKAGMGVTPGAFRKDGAELPTLGLTKNGVFAMYEITIKDEPARHIAAVPHKGSYHKVGEAFEKLSAIFTSRNLWPKSGEAVGVYYDDPSSVAEAELRSHAGMVVSADVEVSEGLEPVDLPAGPHAVLRYVGPYAGLDTPYTYLFGEWLPKSGREVRNSPSFEIYLNSPQDTPANELITDIYLPLEPAK
ncbi:AraC family transcriptional regulator [Pseudovibrio sp. SPO723]|uniref:AraC family transcriptional regulator n=1 Tax=Nesiotobacter zosterae TaxID=392721 RepID=UPI0029C53D96|nr:AraC family transcriptional regulator [Pseudovibrio sp. SPO723]MDX5595259.1 AraC family transcriptional regulator [Pseudovibrio sp. SPO723]